MFEDEMIRAIRNRFAPDIMTAMSDTNPMELHCPLGSIRIPIMATTKLLYDKDLAAFVVRGVVNEIDDKNCLMAQQVFTSREVKDSKEHSDLINYLFDKLKHQFTQALVNGKLDKILAGK